MTNTTTGLAVTVDGGDALDGDARDLAVLREYAALRRQPSNLARFAREFSARDRANADRVEAAIESAMVVRGGGR